MIRRGATSRSRPDWMRRYLIRSERRFRRRLDPRSTVAERLRAAILDRVPVLLVLTTCLAAMAGAVLVIQGGESRFLGMILGLSIAAVGFSIAGLSGTAFGWRTAFLDDLAFEDPRSSRRRRCCRDCGYPVPDGNAGRCPECGKVLQGRFATVLKQHPYRHRSPTIGLLLLVGGIVLAIAGIVGGVMLDWS